MVSQLQLSTVSSMQISFVQLVMCNEEQCIIRYLGIINGFFIMSLYMRFAGTRQKVCLTQNSVISGHILTGFYCTCNFVLVF